MSAYIRPNSNYFIDFTKILDKFHTDICLLLISKHMINRIHTKQDMLQNGTRHSLRVGTEKGQCKFWERRISMICLFSKYVKNCNIFGQILNIWVRLILKKKNNFFFNVQLCLRTLKVLALKICGVLFWSVNSTDVPHSVVEGNLKKELKKLRPRPRRAPC